MNFRRGHAIPSVAMAIAVLLCVVAAGLSAKPSTLLISIDGFRWDYIDLHPCPTIRGLVARGVRAEGLIPCFPSNTFPSHYSIVTGLRPESHGLVSNNMFDPEWNEFFGIGSHPAAREGKWWGGEPIWNTATRQGRTSASYFWPGSEADIQGKFPTWWHPYNYKVPFEERMSEVVGWLSLPAAERPAVVTFYFVEVDDAGHWFGPTSKEAGTAVAKVDAQLGQLLAAIESAGVADEVDIILVSDHGMAETVFERTFVLSEYLEPDETQIDFTGSFAGIRPRGIDTDTIVARLQDVNPHIKVYRREDVPARFHFSSHRRIPEVVLIADEGWQIERVPPKREYYEKRKRGSHGFDNALVSMRGLFVAAGPSFPKGRQIPAFESIHIYNLICAITGLEPAPNDGDDRLVRWLVDGGEP